MYTYLKDYIYIDHICINIFTHTYIYIYLICIYIYMYTHMFVFVSVCVYIYIAREVSGTSWAGSMAAGQGPGRFLSYEAWISRWLLAEPGTCGDFSKFSIRGVPILWFRLQKGSLDKFCSLWEQ